MKQESLSGEDILKFVDYKSNLLEYSKLIEYDDIEDVLGKHGCCILLYQTKENYGHWVVFFKFSPDTIIFFDSYGFCPDCELQLINKKIKDQSNQNYPYLSDLFKKSKYNISFNKSELQDLKKNINTCGKWCGIRILFRKLNNKDFADCFKVSNYSPDDIISKLYDYLK